MGAGSSVGQVLQHPGDVRALLVREADEAGEDEHGQRFGELRDEVGGPPGADGVDEAVGQLLAVLPDLEGVRGFERGHDHLGVPPVLGARGEVDGGHRPSDHGEQRPVLRDVLPLVPEADVTGNNSPSLVTWWSSRYPMTSQAGKPPGSSTGTTGP